MNDESNRNDHHDLLDLQERVLQNEDDITALFAYVTRLQEIVSKLIQVDASQKGDTDDDH